MTRATPPRPRLTDYQPRLEGLDAIAHFLGVSVDTVQRRIRDAGLPVQRDESGRIWSTDVDLMLWSAARRWQDGGPMVLLRPGVAHDMATALGVTEGKKTLALARTVIESADAAARRTISELFNETSTTHLVLPLGDALARDLARASRADAQAFVDAFNASSPALKIGGRPTEGAEDATVTHARRRKRAR